jgi:hypothetical protein
LEKNKMRELDNLKLLIAERNSNEKEIEKLSSRNRTLNEIFEAIEKATDIASGAKVSDAVSLKESKVMVSTATGKVGRANGVGRKRRKTSGRGANRMESIREILRARVSPITTTDLMTILPPAPTKHVEATLGKMKRKGEIRLLADGWVMTTKARNASRPVRPVALKVKSKRVGRAVPMFPY